MYLSGSSPKMNPLVGINGPIKITSPMPTLLPVNDPNNLDEVVVTAKRITPAAPPAEDIPEITVTGKRIQWWQWLLGGAALAGVVAMFTKE